MNYGKLELSVKERFIFKFFAMAFGLFAGWLFYNKIVAGGLIGVILFSLEKEYLKVLQEKRKETIMVQFRDMLYSLASSVSAGRSIGQGLEESKEFLSGTYDEKDIIMQQLLSMTDKIKESNASDIVVLKEFAEESRLDDARDFATVCEICKTLGGNLTKAINKSADIIGDKITMEKELKTILAQKKLEGRIVALSPFVLIFVVRVISPTYLEPLFITTSGRLISSLALSMIIVSWLLIERVNSIEV